MLPDERLRLILLVIGGVEIRGLGGKLPGAGIHHLVDRDSGFRLLQGAAGQGGDYPIRIAGLLGLEIETADVGQPSAARRFVQLDETEELVEEPAVDFGDGVDLLSTSIPPPQGFEYHEQPPVVAHPDPAAQLLLRQLPEFRGYPG